jgi:hypothetical protein
VYFAVLLSGRAVNTYWQDSYKNPLSIGLS